MPFGSVSPEKTFLGKTPKNLVKVVPGIGHFLPITISFFRNILPSAGGHYHALPDRNKPINYVIYIILFLFVVLGKPGDL
jgi:hypothetical protein